MYIVTRMYMYVYIHVLSMYVCVIPVYSCVHMYGMYNVCTCVCTWSFTCTVAWFYGGGGGVGILALEAAWRWRPHGFSQVVLFVNELYQYFFPVLGSIASTHASLIAPADCGGIGGGGGGTKEGANGVSFVFFEISTSATAMGVFWVACAMVFGSSCGAGVLPLVHITIWNMCVVDDPPPLRLLRLLTVSVETCTIIPRSFQSAKCDARKEFNRFIAPLSFAA